MILTLVTWIGNSRTKAKKRVFQRCRVGASRILLCSVNTDFLLSLEERREWSPCPTDKSDFNLEGRKKLAREANHPSSKGRTPGLSTKSTSCLYLDPEMITCVLRSGVCVCVGGVPPSPLVPLTGGHTTFSFRSSLPTQKCRLPDSAALPQLDSRARPALDVCSTVLSP